MHIDLEHLGRFKADLADLSADVYSLMIINCMLLNYLNRKDELEVYLERFIDDFPESADIKYCFNATKKFIEDCRFSVCSRTMEENVLSDSFY